MPKRLKYEGKVYQFPDEATEEQIVSFLQENAPQPDKTITRRAEENLANLKTENPFNRTKSLYAGAPDADRSPGLGDYLDEKLLSAQKAVVGSVPVGIAKSILSLPAGMASSTGRSIGGETFSQDKSYAFPTRSDQDIALEQPVVRGLGPKKGMAPLLFAGGAYGEAPQTGAPADIAKIGPVDPFNLSEEAAFYRDWQRPPERIEAYDQWLAEQDLATRISPIKNGEINPHALKNLLGSGVESAPQMATILGASFLGGPAAGAVAGSALGAGNAGADAARYEAERGFSNPEAAMTAALGGVASGATEAIPIGDMLKRGGAAALKPGFWSAARQAGVNTGKNALEEMPQELTQNYIEAMTAADPSRRMEYAISDPGEFAGRQLEIAAKAGLTSAGFSSVTEAPNLYRGARAKPADIIEGRDGATGMQPVDMKVPERGVSAATAPNPDRAARVVPAGTPVPQGMGALPVDDGILLYDRSDPAIWLAATTASTTPEGLAAFLEANGTPAASGQPSTTNAAQAAPPPLLVPPVAQTDAEVAELAKQIAARPAPPKALEPEEVAKKIERLVADPRTTPEEREILVAKYEQLTKVVQQRGQEAAVAKEMGPQEEPLDVGLPPPDADPYSDDFYLSEALKATDRSASRTDRLGASRPYGEQAGAQPFDVALLEDPPTETPAFVIQERQRLADAARAEQAAVIERQKAEQAAVIERARAEEAARGRAILAALPDSQPSTVKSETRLDLLYDLRVNGRSLSPDERAALDAEIAAEEAKLAPPEEPTPEPGPFAPVPPELRENLRLASPEGVARVRDEGTAREIAKTAPSGRLAMLTDLWHTGTTLSPEERQRLWDKIVLAAGGPVAAREAIQPRFPQGDAPSRLDRVLSETTPALNAPLNQIVDAAQPPPKEEGLAARKARERAEAAKAAAPITISKPPPGPKKPPPPATPAAPKAEPKKEEGLGARKARERAEAEAKKPKAEAKQEPAPVAKEAPVAQPVQQPKAQPAVPAPIADPKLAEQYTPKQLKAAEQLVVLAYHSERTAEDSSQKYAAEREVERAEKQAREAGIDVDAISRSVGREPTGSDQNALPTVAKVIPADAREITPQVTAETSPFMQARREAEAKAKLAETRKVLGAETNEEYKTRIQKAREAKAAADAAKAPEPKPKSPEAKAAEKAQRGKAELNTPKVLEKKLAAAAAKEKALRAKRDANPDDEALLDEYNEATAELYALTKEAQGKGVDTLKVTEDDDAPSLMRTLPQRDAREKAFGNKPVMTREAFDKALEDAKKRLPGIAHLVDALGSQADLPAEVAAVANGDRIDGFTQNGRVAVVADGMTSAEHVAATLAHEAVGHLVPESVFGKNEWRKRLNDMMASSQWFRDFVANFGKSEVGSRYKAAELASEAVAFEANRVLDDANYKPPNAYRMFVAKLREWLREAVGARRVIGLSKVLEFSDRDLAAFLARSKRMAEKGLSQNRRKGDGRPSFAKAAPGAAEPVATAYSEADLIDVPPIEGFDRVRRAMEDDMIALRRAEEAAVKRGTAKEEISMYQASDERHGKAGEETKDVRSQFVTPIIKMAHKAGVTLDEIGDYLYARHALTRNAEGRKRDPDNPLPFSGKTDEWAMETLTRLNPKGEALEDIANVVYAMLAYERKRVVEAGLATKEEVDGWRKTWGATYVPLQHQEMDEARSGNARGYNVLRRAAKQATGRNTEADNPLFSAVSQVQRTIKRAHDAEVGRQFDLFVQANPNPEYWIRNPKPKKKTLKTKENEDGELETKVVTVAEPTFMRDDILHVKDKDGNDVEIQILHKDVLRAMTRAMSGLGNSNAEKMVAFAGAFTRVYGGLLTQYNLEFLISNPGRDVQGAAANIAVGHGQSTDKSGRTKSQIVKTAAKVAVGYGRSLKGIVKFMRDPNSTDEYAQLYSQMRKEGALVGWAPFEDPNKIKNQIQSDMNSLKRSKLHPKEALKKANELIHAANTIAENATRLSVYKTLGDLGITGRQRVRITKNSTVNFNRTGEWGPIYNAGFMFAKPAVGGVAAMLGFVKKSPKRAAQVATTLAMAGWAEGFLNIMFSGDDDEDGYSNYEELMESEKSRNWIFGKNKFPLLHGWGFFVNFGRHIAEAQFGPREWKDLPGATFINLMDSFNPLGAAADPVQAATPWFMDPMIQHYGNKTTFNAPIYPPDPAPGQPTVPDSRRHFRSAPKWAVETAKAVSTATGGDSVAEGGIEVSPETFQFYYDVVTQGAIKLVTRTASAAHNAATGTETRTNDIPFVRRLRTSEHPSVDRGRYIRQKQELTDAYDRAKKYKGLGPKGEEDKNLDRYNDLLAGPLRSRSDFMKLDKLYAQLDDAEGPEVDALKKRVIAVAGRQYELSKKVDKYIALDEGLLDDLEEKVEALSPKKEKVEAKEEIEEDLEGR